MTSFYTENLSDFAEREIAILQEIFTAWNDNGLPDGFEDSGVRPAMNTSSGYVFLVNDEYQVAMLNNDKLEIYHTLPYSGVEGFLTELINDNSPSSLRSDDAEYILYALQAVNLTLHEEWFDYKFNF